jgi:predicted membrane channel-forming protein YqfA (hemolysin III family)
MDFNATDFAVTLGESINWTSTIIGIAGGVFGIYIWFYDRKDMKKATLYYPLFLACQGIIDVINNFEILGEARSRSLFASCAKTLDDIIYEHGSIIHLKDAEDTRRLLSIKRELDIKLELVQKHNWITLKVIFKNDEFKKIEKDARTLIKMCGNEEKILGKL